MKKLFTILMCATIMGTPLMNAADKETNRFIYTCLAATAGFGAWLNILNHWVKKPSNLEQNARVKNSNLFCFLKAIHHLPNPNLNNNERTNDNLPFIDTKGETTNDSSSAPTATQKAWMLTKVATKGAVGMVAFAGLGAGALYAADRLGVKTFRK